MDGISVNGIAISETTIAREVAFHPAPTLEEARGKAVRALVVRQLLLQAARTHGLLGEEDPDMEMEEQAILDLLGRELGLAEPDDAACRAYFASHPEQFRSPDLFEARHILIAADPADASARTAAQAQVEGLIARIQAKPEAFADLARELSACPSGATGGSLGQISRGDTVPELESFLLELEPGQLCPVAIPTPFGYHVLALDHRVDGELLPFEAVASPIADHLRLRSWHQAVAKYTATLAANADIQGVDLYGKG